MVSPRALRGYRFASLELMADAEKKRLGRAVMTPRDRKRAWKRRERAATAMARTPEGRALLGREAEILAGAGQAITMLARAVPDVVPVLSYAIDAFAGDVHEFNLTSGAARRWQLQSAIFASLVYYLTGDAVEMGSRVMAGGRSTTDGTTAAHIAVAGFKDLVTLAAVCSTKAQIAEEAADRVERRASLAAAAMQKKAAFEERRRKEAAAQLQSAEPATVTAEQDITHEPDTHDEQAHAPLHVDAAEPAFAPAPIHRPLAARPVAPPGEPLVWCMHRQQLVPASVAGTPLRSASVVPRHVVEKLKREGQPIPANWTIEPEPAEPEGEPNA